MDMRDQILREAVHLFGSLGYDATSLQKIAEAVGVTKQALLYHFSSKEELHRAVVESEIEHWRRELPVVLAKTLPSYDRFNAMMAALLEFFGSDPNRARFALREMLDRPAALRGLLAEHLSPLLGILTEYIRMGQASGLIQPDLCPESYVVQVMIMVISSAATGGVASGIVGAADAEAQDERNRNELVRMARRALFVPKRSQDKKA